MYIISLWELKLLLLLTPELNYHVYVKGAPHFQKTHDVYDHWALFVAEEGRFYYRMDEGAEERAVAGDMVLCPPGVTFYRRTEGLSFHLLGFQWQGPEAAGQAREEALHGIGKLRLLNQPRLQSTLALLRETLHAPAAETMPFKRHLLRDLLYAWQMEKQALYAAPLHTDHPVVRGAVELMHRHADTGLPLKSIARQLGISQVQLTRLFQQQFQLSPSVYAARLRVDKVKQLLVRTTLPLSRIAEQCGYTDEHHLSKSFKKLQGMNPSVYRRAHQI
ncbi:helix-turn-helix domain-containing protein [Paenibacillus sp. 1P07SE]|uniref:helix-turn-helix domain-containing protein n=1 Tax=Paenibacillus sp. 1P07SE TaxID=3132209 RepID=UPI0039A601F8